jgi:hypothetical protein
MALAVEAEDHGRETVIDEDQPTVAVVPVDEHAHGLKREITPDFGDGLTDQAAG